MPTIKFKLKDKDYCDGCPCLKLFNLGASPQCCLTWQEIEIKTHKGYLEYIRPQRCKDELGE